MKTKKEKFSAALLRHKKRLKLTQDGMALALGVTERTYWGWEHGQEPLVLTQEGALARLEAMPGELDPFSSA